MKQFEATAESIRHSRSGEGFKVTGSINEVIGAAVLDSKETDLIPMAAEILENQMKNLEVGDKLMFNWACSVLNIKVERIS